MVHTEFIPIYLLCSIPETAEEKQPPGEFTVKGSAEDLWNRPQQAPRKVSNTDLSRSRFSRIGMCTADYLRASKSMMKKKTNRPPRTYFCSDSSLRRAAGRPFRRCSRGRRRYHRRRQLHTHHRPQKPFQRDRTGRWRTAAPMTLTLSVQASANVCGLSF